MRWLGRVADRVDLDAHPALDEVVGDRVVGLDVGADLEQLAVATSRRTTITGCTSSCTSRLRAVSAPVTESTRNGMSSVTSSTTRVARIGRDSDRRSFSSPGLRLRGQLTMGAGGVEQRARGQVDQFLVGGEPPVALHQLRVGSRPSRPGAAAGERHRGRDQALAVGKRLVEVAVIQVVGQRDLTKVRFLGHRVDTRAELGVAIISVLMNITPLAHHAVGHT